MSFLYITADRVGVQTGGGTVTAHELQALNALGPTALVQPDANIHEPFLQDADVEKWLAMGHNWEVSPLGAYPKMAHLYAGCFTNSVQLLKSRRVKVTYTAAAHSVEESKREHELLGLPFQYPHLTDPALWQKYLGGYLAADVLICPSNYSAAVMRSYGYQGRVVVIPHGCTVPLAVVEPPRAFTVGYLGAAGPDKGLIYLLQAWRALGYRDGSRLLLAGKFCTPEYIGDLVLREAGDMSYTVGMLGWQNQPRDLYDAVSLYVQPSVTEGFGIEVLEAMAHARPVLCSLGAGAHDLVPEGWKFAPRDVKELAKKIDAARRVLTNTNMTFNHLWMDRARQHTWEAVRAMYQKVWKEVLG